MFRPLKNYYFLLSKYRVVNNRRQKSLQISRFFSSVNGLSARDETKRMLVSRTEPNWKELLKKVELFEPLRSKAEIYVLRCCGENRLGKQMLSFLKFLMNNGTLSITLLKIFLDIVRKEKYYQPCHPFVYHLLKKFIVVDVSVAERCVITLLENPVYLDKVVKICMENIHVFSTQKEIIQSLLLHNKIEEAFKLYISCPISNGVEEFLVNYLLDGLNTGRISIDATEVIINLIKKLDNQLCQLYPQLSSILKLMNEKKEKGYRWKMASKPCIKSHCEVCQKNLETSSVTDDEMMYLLAAFEKNVISQYNSLPAFKEKWNDFNKFLKFANYNAVIDGLNYLYRVSMETNKLEKTLQILRNKNKCPLIISRHHSRYIISPSMKTACLAYFTDDVEYDDVYVVYAALKQGKGCLLITMDKYGFFSSIIERDKLSILQRWKETHVCKFSPFGDVMWPHNVKTGVQEENCKDPSEFKCHVIVPVANHYDKLFCVEKLKLTK